MAYSHDRTLLASLGFSDPDKKNPRHDLACRYVNQPHVICKLLKRKFPKLETVSVEPTQECHLTKGDGQYRTTIGFLDSLTYFSGSFASSELYPVAPAFNELDIPPEDIWPCTKRKDFFSSERNRIRIHLSNPAMKSTKVIVDGYLLIEVKINKIPIGDILRQFNLYRSYMISVGCRYEFNERHIFNDWNFVSCRQKLFGYEFIESLGSYFSRNGFNFNICENIYNHKKLGGLQSLLVTDFQLSEQEYALLNESGIQSVRLGDDFNSFFNNATSTSASMFEL